MMQKFLQFVMVFILALIATNGAASQDLLEAKPSNVQLESPAKRGLATPTVLNNNTWTSGGPIGGYVTCLAVALSNPDIMYAGSKGSIYRTSDGGATWTWVGDVYKYSGDTPSTTSFATILDLQIAPDNPDIVYAGTESGINISQNGGRDWNNTWSGFYVVVNSIAVDPTNPKNVLIGTGDTNRQSTEEIIGIFKSTDGGMTWQEKLPRESTGEELDAVHTILFDTNNTQTVYAGVEKYDELGEYNGGLRKSIDGGETWIPLKVNSVDNVFALAMTPSGFSPATIYAYAAYSTDGDIYASTDDGVTWVPLENPDPGVGVPLSIRPFMVVDPGNAKQFYSSGHDSLYKYDSDAEQWTEIAPGVFLIRPRGMVISPQNGEMFVGAYTGGFFQSSDGGNQWVPANLTNTKINDLAIDPNDSQTAYAAVDGGVSLAKTNNRGDAWDYLANSESYLGAVAIDPQVPTTIYAAKDTQTLRYTGSLAFIYKSVNSGQDWDKISYLRCALDPCEITIQKILVSAVDSNHILLAGTGDSGLLGRTTNGGTSWVKFGEPWEVDEHTALAADPNDPDVVYGGMTWRNGVHRYTDVWGDWTRTTQLPEDGLGGVSDIAVDQGSRYWWAGGGLRRKEFQGESTHFTNLPTDTIMAVTIDRTVSPNVVYIGTYGMGVYVSEDDGVSWTAMNDGLGSLFITNLQVSEGQPKVLYAGTRNRGVWSTTIGNGSSISIPLYLPLVVKD